VQVSTLIYNSLLFNVLFRNFRLNQASLDINFGTWCKLFSSKNSTLAVTGQGGEGGRRCSIVCHKENLARRNRSVRQAIAVALEFRLIR
jgi:hypothetical protein